MNIRHVYVLNILGMDINGVYDEGWIQGVYTTISGAKREIKRLAKEKEWEDYEDDYKIEEFDLED